MLQRFGLVVALLGSIVGSIVYLPFLSADDVAVLYTTVTPSAYRTPRPTFPPQLQPTLEQWPTALASVLAPHPTQTPAPAFSPPPSSEQMLRLLTEIPAPVQATGGDVAFSLHYNAKTNTVLWESTSGLHLVEDITLLDTIQTEPYNFFSKIVPNDETGYTYMTFLSDFQVEDLLIFDGTELLAQFGWFGQMFRMESHPSESFVYLFRRPTIQSDRQSAIDIISGTQIVKTILPDPEYSVIELDFSRDDNVYVYMQRDRNYKISLMQNDQIVNSSIVEFNNSFGMYGHEQGEYLYVKGGYDTIDDAEAGLEFFNFTVVQGEQVLLQTDIRDRFPGGAQGRWYLFPELSNHIFVEHNVNNQLVELAYENGEVKELARFELHDGFIGEEIVADAVNQKLYYVDSDDKTLYIVDIDQKRIIQQLPTCSLPSSPVFDPSTSQLYVACGWTEKLLVFGYE